MSTIITGTGSYIPSIVKTNQSFVNNSFYAENGELIATPSDEIVEKFKDITGIAERRYADANENTSEMATKAAVLAIKDAGIDPETIDQIIVAHNFGNCKCFAKIIQCHTQLIRFKQTTNHLAAHKA